ncbi:4Fe-4S dicluster domain-containing protein [Desulfitobacterium sp. Sab5]|uniref:4Fe-4S dicluster domain-containing protein n=1 Tax=Desulfitobacterium nosdiversum TaxID=3375356 RepID=UPI003CF02386
MVHQVSFLFNPNRCLGCRACQMACAVNHDLPPGVFLRKVVCVEFVKETHLVKYYLSSSCNHCENPECFRLCPQRAYRKRRDGIVVYDAGKCNGCGTCTRSCPFGAPMVNPVTGKVIKCDLCFDRLEEGESPFCVNACPVYALKLFDTEASEGLDHKLIRSLPGVPRIQITHPAVRYLPLEYGKQFGLSIDCKEGDEY